ncbi:MAG: flippase-like domain-containing protein [Planctomycetes bacterium]|nr:flippase-like domain-containing protein [Planctomycetota bacterium]
MKRILRLLPFALGFVLLALLIHKVGFRPLVDTLASVDLRFQPLLIGIYLLAQALSAAALFVLIRPLAPACRFLEVFLRYLVVSSVALATPGRIGDFLMAAHLRTKGVPFARGCAVVFADKAITLFAYLLIAAAGAYPLLGVPAGAGLTAALLAGLAAFGILARSDRLESRVERLLSGRRGPLRGGYSQLRAFCTAHIPLLLVNLLLTGIRMAVASLFLWVLLRSLGVSVGFVGVLLVHALVQIVLLIPITVSGLGIREGAMVGFFVLIGVEASAACAAALLTTVLAYLYAAAILVLSGSNPRRSPGRDAEEGIESRGETVAARED